MAGADLTGAGRQPEAGGGADGRVTVARGRQEGTVARVARVLRTERVAGISAIGAVAVLVVALVGFGGGAHSVLPRLSDIGAWLNNDSQGSVTHANGLSGKADTRLTLTNAAGHPLTVIQDGDTVLVKDTVTGTVTRIDPARLTVTQSVTYGSPDVQIVTGGGKAYVVDPDKGLVQAIDPDRLSVIGPPVSLPAPLGTAAVDGHGTVWVPVLRTAQLTPVTGGSAGTPVAVGSPGDSFDVTIAGGAPVVTDTTAATMTVLPPEGGRRTVNLPTGRVDSPARLLAPASTDGAVVPLLDTGTHQMVVVDTAAGRPTSVNLDGFERDDLGSPEALGGRVYVPDSTTGRLIVYDSGSGRLLNQVNVSGHAGRISLFLNDGMLWANDASGSAAVSVDSSGAVHTVSKYTPDLPGGPLPSAASPTPSKNAGGGPDPGSGGGVGRRPTPGGNGHRPGPGNGQGGGRGTGRAAPPAPPPPPVAKSPTPKPPVPKSPTPKPSRSKQPAPPATTPAGAPPDSAHGVSESPGDGYITVDFSPSAGATPENYTLAGLPSGASADPSSVPAGGPYSFRVTGLSCDQSYRITVVANYSTGPKEATGDGARPCVVPSAPRNLSLDGSQQGQIGASWQAPSSDGGGSLSYDVTAGGKSRTTSGTSATITGLSNFSSYEVTVAAVNGAGSSQPPASDSVTITHAPWAGHVCCHAIYEVEVRSSASADASIVHSFPAGTADAVTVKCEKTGGHWEDPTPSHSPSGNTWYQVTGPYPGYIATGYVSVSGVWSC